MKVEKKFEPIIYISFSLSEADMLYEALERVIASYNLHERLPNGAYNPELNFLLTQLKLHVTL